MNKRIALSLSLICLFTTVLSSQSLKRLAKNSIDRVESYVFRYENGKIQEDSFLVERTFIDPNGRLTKSEFFELKSLSTDEESQVLTYEALDGTRFELTERSVQYTYDSSKKISESYFINGEPDSECLIRYDKDGYKSKIEIEEFAEKKKRVIKYEYNTNGKLVLEKYSKDNWFKYYYDEKGRRTFKYFKHRKGGELKWKAYTYEGDSKRESTVLEFQYKDMEYTYIGGPFMTKKGDVVKTTHKYDEDRFLIESTIELNDELMAVVKHYYLKKGQQSDEVF